MDQTIFSLSPIQQCMIREFTDIGTFKYPFCEECGTDEHFSMEHRSNVSSFNRNEQVRERPPATSNPATNQAEITQSQQKTNTTITNTNTNAPSQQQPNTPTTQRRLTVAARIELQLKK
jgi:hypothetical protein